MFAAEDFDPVEVWPENWPAVEFFMQFSTQWRTGFSGATGLDYQVVFSLLDRRVSGDEWQRMFDDLRVMEQAALAAMRTDP